ncbi:hypothetical protein VaNZ11_000685 [Volvox africanus]|uniref:Aminotransferase class V domain-containing protein n=1 Tax=Volvox africanus TaxID=51714 RepID=A0ABQ5RNX3_9CHLO|nr:hypothetical protein VaNZ11_000685 [Volvox africanus]
MGPSASDYARARAAFDYFLVGEDTCVAFMENAGGSQVPRCVVDAISNYFVYNYAQLGAGYSRSERATSIVGDAHSWLEVFMNTQGQGQVVLGSSTSQLAFNLASAFADCLGPGDSIVLQEASHESVLGPWVRLANRNGFKLHWWRADRRSGASHLADLEALLGPATRLVVVTHVSNLMGEILDLTSVVKLVRRRAPGAQVMADGVAFAPHRAINVFSWDVDWYLWSAYKVYGPHVGVMYGKRQAYDSLLSLGGQGPNFYFVPASDLTYKFELGGVSHEGCAGLLALQDYLLHLLGTSPTSPETPPQHHHQQELEQNKDQNQDQDPPQQLQPGCLGQSDHRPQETEGGIISIFPPLAPPLGAASAGKIRMSRSQVEAAFTVMTTMEKPLQEQLLSYLASHPAVRLVGSANADPAVRVPTISFVHRCRSSQRVARELQAAGFAVRYGHMYARRLVEALSAEGGLIAEEAAQRQAAEGEDPVAAAAATVAGAACADGGDTVASVATGSSAVFDEERAINEGVVRISLLHYNSPKEVSQLIEALGNIL